MLKEIQNAADRADRLFPLSLGAEGSCQIGGNISTNAGGVNVLRYGNTRNLVLGLEVVLPDGRVWDGLRGLRKDNTGYDMKQVFIGAEGTLGIVTAAVLRLFPKPTASETAWIGIDSPAAGVALLGHVRARLGDTVSAFELIGRPIIELLLAGVPGHEDPMAEVHPWYVLMDVTSQGPPGSLHGALADALGAALEAGLVHDALDRRLRRAGRAAVEDAREPGRGAGGGGRRHRPRRVRARVAHPGIHRARGRGRGGRLSRHPPLRLRPRRRRQHALQPDQAAWIGMSRAIASSARASTASCTTSSPTSPAPSAPSTASAARGWPSSSTTSRRSSST